MKSQSARDIQSHSLVFAVFTPQSVVGSEVDLVSFLQCKQFVVKFAMQCGCRVSFKYFVGLFVVNKRVHFVVVVCLVPNNSNPSLVCSLAWSLATTTYYERLFTENRHIPADYWTSHRTTRPLTRILLSRL